VLVADDGDYRLHEPATGDGRRRTDDLHFIGVQVASARAFARLETRVPAESVNALYPRLIAEQPGSVAGYVSQASFLDIGTPRDCLDTSVALAQWKAPDSPARGRHRGFGGARPQRGMG
jgi:NDP-sugar pyrophosphorylase family protein